MALVAIMGLIVCFEVVSRYVFNSPTTWAAEYAAYLLAALVFIAAAGAQHNGDHVRMDIVLNRLPDGGRRLLTQASGWVEVFVISIWGWKLVAMTYSSFATGERTPGLLATPQWVPQLPVALGALLFAAATVLTVRPCGGRARGWTGLVLLSMVAALLLVFLFVRPAMSAERISLFVVGAATLAGALLAGSWRVAVLTVAIMGAVAGLFALSAAASPLVIFAAIMAGVAVALVSGVAIGPALGLIGILGVYFYLPAPVFALLADRAWALANSFTLTSIPMFILMGAVLLRSGIAEAMLEGFAKLMGRLPGSVAYASIGASGFFAAVSGSSLATAATIGRIAGADMVGRGYSPSLAYGVIAAGGTLGILIPPSIAMIFYGSFVGVSVTDLFMAGLLPGFLMMALFSLVTSGWIWLRPEAAPRGTPVPWGEKLRALGGTAPFIVLIMAVLGGLYAGVVTPTAAGALGAAMSIAICALKGRLSRQILVASFSDAALVTAALMVIAIGATQMSAVLDYLAVPAALVGLLSHMDLSPVQLIVLIVVMYVILGTMLDPLSMVLMTLPVVIPLIKTAGFDLIWFGVVLVAAVEIGLITPPIGMVLFVLKSVGPPSVTLRDIAVGAVPYACSILLGIAILYAVPEIATWLPAQLK